MILERIGMAAAGALLLAGCAVSDSEEREMGSQYVQQINAQLPLITDPRVVGYITALGTQIARKTDLVYRLAEADGFTAARGDKRAPWS